MEPTAAHAPKEPTSPDLLTDAERAQLKPDDFAVPGQRKLPIHNANHARLAWAALDHTEGLSDDEKATARSRIAGALARFGVQTAAAEDRSVTLEPLLPDPLEYSKDTRAQAMILPTHVVEAAINDEAAHVVEVTIIRPGVSANGYNYTPQVLREAIPLWDGAAAFLDHPTAIDLTRAGQRSLRDLVGVYEQPRWDHGIRANLRISDPAAFHTVKNAIDAKKAGRPAPQIGISADQKVLKTPAPPGAQHRWDVHAITAVQSGDLVFRPSAGGSFDRILEAHSPLTAISYKEYISVPDATATASPAKNQTPVTTPVTTPVQTPVATDAHVREATANDQVLTELRAMKAQLAAAQLDAKLATSGLPAPAQQQIRAQFAGRVFESTEADTAIGSLKSLLGDIFGQHAIKGAGYARDPGARVVSSPLDRIQAAFDQLFGLDVAPELASVPRLSGIREAYIAITGDKFFTGKYVPEESVVREANETTSSVMANVVLNSMTKRLVKDYQAQPKWWEPIAIKVPVLDMKQQNRVRLSDFGALASVSEAAAYANIAWGDARENYTPTKFGNIVAVTLEMFLNDDLRAVQRIPTKLAHSAVVTLNEQVAALFTASSGTGPTLSDTYHVFDAANHQGNTSSSTTYDLSQAALQSAMTVLEKMQNSASKRIGVKGRWLLIPPDLRWTAQVITQSTYVTTSANNDANPLTRAIIPLVVPQFTTAYQWYLMADPTQVESIEIGFLNGREEPELLVQDNPTAGSVFSNDEISYKVRHIYGLGWLDYRGAFAALPAS